MVVNKAADGASYGGERRRRMVGLKGGAAIYGRMG